MSKFRTHRCDEIRLSDVGKKVVISGFVETIRDLGGVVFLDIRDMYGITQVVTSGKTEDVEFASHIPVESTVKVTGTVRKRAEETLNELGLSIADAINVFLNQVILNDGIPLVISTSTLVKKLSIPIILLELIILNIHTSFLKRIYNMVNLLACVFYRFAYPCTRCIVMENRGVW